MVEKRIRRPRQRASAPSDVEAPHPWAFLADWREHAGYAMRAVAEALKTTQPTVHRWEKGTTRLPVERLIELAKLYGAEHPSDLSWPPGAIAEGDAKKKFTDEARWIAERLPEKISSDWLAMGRTLLSMNLSEGSGPSSNESVASTQSDPELTRRVLELRRMEQAHHELFEAERRRWREMRPKQKQEELQELNQKLQQEEEQDPLPGPEPSDWQRAKRRRRT